MDDVIGHSRKPVVCRYFAASGTCFYGNDCQFLHSSTSRTNVSPTFPLNSFSSSVQTGNSTATSSVEVSSLSILESNIPTQSYRKNVNKLAVSNPVMQTKDEYLLETEELSISPDTQVPGVPNPSLFEVCFLNIMGLNDFNLN